MAGGFSFGTAVALKAIAGSPGVRAYIGVGLPLATESARGLPRPEGPALFVVGEEDALGPPEFLRRFAGSAGRIVEIPGADHFLEGKLPLLEEAIAQFLRELPAPVPAP
ncbi:MAG: hypothetical protein ACRD3M_08855 [Thermoanaerobaculia bacterium]